MPNYNFECQDCKNIFEVTVSIKDMEKGHFPCDRCGSKKTRRLFDGFGFCNGNAGSNNISSSRPAYPT